MRDRLIELILNTPVLKFPSGSRAQGKTYQTAQNVADHLLANGVIVPPCKVGDTVCAVDYQKRKVTEIEVRSIEYEAERTTVKCVYWESEVKGLLHRHDYYFYFADFGKTVFLTKEEAEKALAERSGK